MGSHFCVYFYGAPAALRAALPASLYGFVSGIFFPWHSSQACVFCLAILSTSLLSRCRSVILFSVICDLKSSAYSSHSPVVSTANLTPKELHKEAKPSFIWIVWMVWFAPQRHKLHFSWLKKGNGNLQWETTTNVQTKIRNPCCFLWFD